MRTQVPSASRQRPVTVNSAAQPGTLFLEDTFPVIRGLDSESIDLIATAPPFDKGERTPGNHLRLGSAPGTRMFGGVGRAGDGV